MTSRRRRLSVGRLSFYVAWYDMWVGLFVRPGHAVYFCPVPCVVFRWSLRRDWRSDRYRDEIRRRGREAAARMSVPPSLR